MCRLMEGVPSAPPPFILASGSSARLRVLRDAGFAPLVVVSGVPEDVDGMESAQCGRPPRLNERAQRWLRDDPMR